jgi:predicted RNase H-like HicB family nuclease
MGFDDYKVVLYRNQPDGWLAEIPAIAGCHALMPTLEEALAELAQVFRMIEPTDAQTTRALVVGRKRTVVK